MIRTKCLNCNKIGNKFAAEDNGGKCPICRNEGSLVIVSGRFIFVNDGDANFYTILSDKGWFASIHLNGEMSIVEHFKIMQIIVDRLNEKEDDYDENNC